MSMLHLFKTLLYLLPSFKIQFKISQTGVVTTKNTYGTLHDLMKVKNPLEIHGLVHSKTREINKAGKIN